MEPTVKVVRKNITGLLVPSFDDYEIAAQITEEERLGWQLVTSYGLCLGGRAYTDTLVFIYRKKSA